MAVKAVPYILWEWLGSFVYTGSDDVTSEQSEQAHEASAVNYYDGYDDVSAVPSTSMKE